MNTTEYTGFNMETMIKIVSAINSLPESYALRNEGVKGILMRHIGILAN